MRRISIVIVAVGALQALLAACDPFTAVTVASTVVKGAAVASVQDDENAKDCSQQGLAQCEREWRQEKLAQAEALAFAQTMAEPEPTGETDAHAAFAAFLRSDEMSDGWVFLCTAANLGHPQAQLLLARAYKDGWEPVARNDVKAYTWYRLAIAGGHGFARDEMKSVAVRMEPEVRTWAEINSANWQPDYGECEVSLEATLQGA